MNKIRKYRIKQIKKNSVVCKHFTIKQILKSQDTYSEEHYIFYNNNFFL